MPRRMDSSLHGVACAVAQAVGVLPLALFPCFAMADNYYNPAFLSNDPSAVADLSRFEKTVAKRRENTSLIFTLTMYLSQRRTSILSHRQATKVRLSPA